LVLLALVVCIDEKLNEYQSRLFAAVLIMIMITTSVTWGLMTKMKRGWGLVLFMNGMR